MGIKINIILILLTMSISSHGYASIFQTIEISLISNSLMKSKDGKSSDSSITINDSIKKPRLWAVAIPFNLILDTSSVDSLTENLVSINSKNNWIASNKMASEFYTGFRAAIDTLNASGENIKLIVVDHIEKKNTYRIQDDPNKTFFELSPKEFLGVCEALSVEKIIGPFRSNASEMLAKFSSKITVINPVSRSVNTENNPQLIAAASSRKAETISLGKRAAIERQNNDSSITVLLLTKKSKKMRLDSVFTYSYSEMGGDIIELVSLNISDETDFQELVSRGPSNYLIRYVLLDNNVLTAAQVLSAFRLRDPMLTELWTMGSNISSNALDSYLLLRQPVVWAQIERADHVELKGVFQYLKRYSGYAPGRWEWLGFDMAVFANYMKSNIPAAYSGPRRLYLWKHKEGDGYMNQSSILFRFDSLGVNRLDIIPTFELPNRNDSLIDKYESQKLD